MAKCPSCGHPVEEDATACPNCPASWHNDEEAAYRARYSPFARPGRHEPLLLAVLAGAALIAAWKSLGFVLTWGGSESKSSPIVQFVDKRAPIHLPESPRVLADKPSPPAAPASPSDEDGSGLVTISHDDSGQARHWRFRGRVFNLETLEPISRCAVEFTDSATGARFETGTDGDGLYRAELPPVAGGGYLVKVHAGGYAPSYLDPATPNVPGLSAQERRELAKGLQHSLDGPSTVQADSERPVSTDFYLAPAD